MAAETYPGWSVLVWKLFLELHFFWRYEASVTVTMW